MRWTSAVAVLALTGAGLMACGSDGGEEAELPTASPGDTDAAPTAADEATDAGDPGNCPPVGPIEQLLGKDVEVEDFTDTDDMLTLGCYYRSEDFYQQVSGAAQFQMFCHTYDADEADDHMAVIGGNDGVAPYPVGDAGFIEDDSYTDNGTGAPVVGEKAYVRSGNQICDAWYDVFDPGTPEAPPEFKQALEYLLTTTASGA